MTRITRRMTKLIDAKTAQKMFEEYQGRLETMQLLPDIIADMMPGIDAVNSDMRFDVVGKTIVIKAS